MYVFGEFIDNNHCIFEIENWKLKMKNWKIEKWNRHIDYDIQWMNKKIELLENEYYYKTYR